MMEGGGWRKPNPVLGKDDQGPWLTSTPSLLSFPPSLFFSLFCHFSFPLFPLWSCVPPACSELYARHDVEHWGTNSTKSDSGPSTQLQPATQELVYRTITYELGATEAQRSLSSHPTGDTICSFMKATCGKREWYGLCRDNWSTRKRAEEPT